MQRFRTAIKKMAAIGAGVAMTGATIMGALAAADLNQYPAPFVDKGKFNPDTAIVVGANAAASDTLGSVDIARQLQFDSKVCVPGSTGTGGVSVSGDSYQIGDSSDLLELNEDIGNVQESITDLELDGLKGGIITTNEGTTEFNQYLRFKELNASSSNTLRNAPAVNFTESDAPISEVSDWLFVAEGSTTTDAFFEYEIEFEDGLESEVVSKKLEDYEDEELVMLGTTYTFVDTKIDTASDDITLSMLGGSVFDILEEGEEKTYNVNGKEYKVEVMIIEDATPATVTFVINGEVTSQMTDGETEILKDGTLIGISNIVLNEAGEAGSGDIVELYIGATKVEFKDNDYTDGENSNTNLGYEQGVEIDEESIEDAWVQIKGSELSTDGSKFEISSIRYRLVADALPGYKDLWIPAGHGVREFLDEPQGMLGTNWDIRYEGLDDTGVSMIKIDPKGDDEYTIEFENKQGTVYKLPYVTNENGILKYGDNNKDLVFIEGNYTEGMDEVLYNGTGAGLTNSTEFNIGILDYFVLSDANKNIGGSQPVTHNGNIQGPAAGDSSVVGHYAEDSLMGGFDNTATTHIVRYNSIDTSEKVLSFDEEGAGTKQFTYEVFNASAAESIGKARLIFGGNTYLAYIGNVTNSQNPLAIDMDADGDIDRTEIRLTTNGGAIIDLGEAARSDGGLFTYGGTDAQSSWTNTGENLTESPSALGIVLNITTLSEDYDESAPSSSGATTSTNGMLTFNITNRTDNKLGVDTTSFSPSIWEPDDDDNNLYGMTDYGAKINVFDPSGATDAETVTIEYPLVQRGANVFITMGDTKTSKTKAGEVCTVADIELNNLLDSEVSDPTDYNLILVGGPCANQLVGKIAGFPTCTAWTAKPGEAIVQLAENGENVAMLIAGTDAPDTRAAAKVVANYDEYADDFAGMKVMVSGGKVTSA